MAYLLIAATNGKQLKKGEILFAKDTAIFGKRERLPDWIRLEVTGVTAAEVGHFKQRWLTSLIYTIVNENVNGWRVRIELDPRLETAAGIDRTIKQAYKDWVLSSHEGNWAASVVAGQTNQTQLTVDIAKNQPFGLAEIQQESNNWWKDRLETQSGFQQYHFSGTDVDWGVSQGTVLEENNEDEENNIPVDLIHHTMTKSEVLSRIVNRLE